MLSPNTEGMVRAGDLYQGMLFTTKDGLFECVQESNGQTLQVIQHSKRYYGNIMEAVVGDVVDFSASTMVKITF